MDELNEIISKHIQFIHNETARLSHAVEEKGAIIFKHSSETQKQDVFRNLKEAGLLQEINGKTIPVGRIDINSKAGADLMHMNLAEIGDCRPTLEYFWRTMDIKCLKILQGIQWGLQNDNLLVTYSMSRSFFEFVAVSFDLKNNCTATLNEKITLIKEKIMVLGKIKTHTLKTLYGTRFEWNTLLDLPTEPGLTAKKRGKEPWKYSQKPNSIDFWASIYNSIDSLNIILPDARQKYDYICEFIHPNIGTNFLIMQEREIIQDSRGLLWVNTISAENLPTVVKNQKMLLPNTLELVVSLIGIRNKTMEIANDQINKTSGLSKEIIRELLNQFRKSTFFDPYSECYCGSGIKIKYCCLNH